MEVAPNFKPDLTACVCGCGTIARPRAKAWQDGLGAHAKGCPCRRCRAGRYRKNEGRRVKKFAIHTGLEKSPLSGALSGFDLGSQLLIIEETANVAVVRGLRKWWENKGTQDKLARVRAQQVRPWAFAASWDGKVRLVVMDADGFAALCQAAGSDLA